MECSDCPRFCFQGESWRAYPQNNKYQVYSKATAGFGVKSSRGVEAATGGVEGITTEGMERLSSIKKDGEF